MFKIEENLVLGKVVRTNSVFLGLIVNLMESGIVCMIWKMFEGIDLEEKFVLFGICVFYLINIWKFRIYCRGKGY